MPKIFDNEIIPFLNMREKNISDTISNSKRTIFSDSPRYFDVNVEEDTLKKVVPHSVATAFANIVFPVPGGPTMSTPFHGLRIPNKSNDENSLPYLNMFLIMSLNVIIKF